MSQDGAAHGRRISVVGLGYVGLPVAVAFGQQQPVLGFDIAERRIAELRGGHDHTGEVSEAELTASRITFTADPARLREADFHIVAVPTPVDSGRQPDLTPVLRACELLAPHLASGAIVVFESTVYPGVTEEVCKPLLEHGSGLVCGRDFFLGYSPERINPGDKQHRFTAITKVVSGQDAATLDTVAAVYGSVVTAGVHRAPSIKVAEAAKVIENTQRDLNIALMNELAMIFSRLGISTRDVLAAARTKWNFLPFTPGLVGGHCIGVDPYYLTFKAEQVGFHPEVILAGRRTNDGMSVYVAAQLLKGMIHQGHVPQQSTVTVLGLTFKENVPDLRNSKVVEVVRELEGYRLQVQVHDPLAEPEEAQAHYGLTLTPREALRPAQAVLLAVPHADYLQGGWPFIESLLAPGKALVGDLKSVLPDPAPNPDIALWRL